MQDAGDNPFAIQPQGSGADNPFLSLPVDPNTGRPIISIGPGTSAAPTPGGGEQPSPSPVPAAPAEAAPTTQPQPPPQPSGESPDDIEKAYRDFRIGVGRPEPQAPAPVPSVSGVGEPPMSPDQTEQMYQDFSKEATLSQVRQTKGIGSFGDIADSFNEDFIQNAVNPTLSAGKALLTMPGVGGEMTNVGPDVAEHLTQMGLEYLRDPSRASVDAKEMFQRMGFTPGYHDTYMSDAGRLVWSTIATSLAMMYGAAALENAQKARGVATAVGNVASRPLARAGSMIVQKYNQIVREHPMMWLTSELMGAVGSTIGGEKAADFAEGQGASPAARQVAEAAGSISGGVAGGGVGAFVAVKVGNATIRVSKLLARGIVQTIDSIQHLATGKSIGPIAAIGRPGPPIQVDQDALNTARAVETRARAAGDEVVEARKGMEKEQKGTQAFSDALARMALAQSEEKETGRAAERAWNMIPAEVRGKYSRQQTAIRDKFAETEFPRAFAEQQVQGEQLAIDTAMNDAIMRVGPQDPTKGLAGNSAELTKTLWNLRKQAKGVLSKYWTRVKLDRVMPKGIPYQRALDGFVENLHEMGYDDKHVPVDSIARWRDAFSATNIKDGGRPSLAWVKQQMTDMQEEANKAYVRGDTSLGANYDRLHGMVFNLVSQAFPDDVPLQQARAVSKKYFDLFTRSNLGQLFQMSRTGAPQVHEEDTFKTLLNRARGFRDLRQAVDWLNKKGIVNIKDPDFVTKGQQQNIAALENTATQALRAHVSEYINGRAGDMAAAAKMLGDPAFQRQIASLGKVSAEMQQSAKEFSGLVQRRKVLEKSALAKFMQSDPDKAIDTVWNSRDPAATAEALMEGTPGVGGFRQDPAAMSGFEGGLLTKFQAASQGDPDRMKELLSGTRGRLLRTVMGDAKYGRLENLVNRLGTVAEEQVKATEHRQYKTLLAQYAALKVLAHLPEIFEVGEGGSLKRASLVSGFTKDYIEGMVHGIPPEDMLKTALDNPEYEQSLYAKLPWDAPTGKEVARTMRRAAGYERGIWGYFDNFMTYGDGDGPTKDPSPTGDHMGGISDYFIGSANAMPFQQRQQSPVMSNPEITRQQLRQEVGERERAMTPRQGTDFENFQKARREWDEKNRVQYLQNQAKPISSQGPKGETPKPISPAMEEIRRRIERGEFKPEGSRPPVNVPGEHQAGNPFRMAGDIVPFPDPGANGPLRAHDLNLFNKYRPGGYENNPNAVAKGVMSGKIKVLRPGGEK